MRHFLIFFVTFLLTSLSYNDYSETIVPIEKSEQDKSGIYNRLLLNIL